MRRKQVELVDLLNYRLLEKECVFFNTNSNCDNYIYSRYTVYCNRFKNLLTKSSLKMTLTQE